MNSDLTFITNEKDRNLKNRFETLIKDTACGSGSLLLRVARYVDEIVTEIKKIDRDMIYIDKKITSFCQELGIDSLFGE